MSIPSNLAHTARLVAAATAAEVRSEPGDVEILCEEVLELVGFEDAFIAAICLSRIFLRRLPTPGSAAASFSEGVGDRFAPPVAAIGEACLLTSTLPDTALAGEEVVALLAASQSMGELYAIKGAVAASWWALTQASATWGTDPLEDVQALCLKLSAMVSQ